MKRLVNYVLVFALAVTTASVLAQEGVSQHNPDHEFQNIVGSWKLVDDQNGSIFFGTYAGGPFKGTVNFTSPNNFTSLTHGAWKRTGRRTFADTDSGFIYDEHGDAVRIITFRAEIEVSEDGDMGVFDFEFEVSKLDGTIVQSGASTATGTRIKVQPLSRQ